MGSVLAELVRCGGWTRGRQSGRAAARTGGRDASPEPHGVLRHHPRSRHAVRRRGAMESPKTLASSALAPPPLRKAWRSSTMCASRAASCASTRARAHAQSALSHATLAALTRTCCTRSSLKCRFRHRTCIGGPGWRSLLGSRARATSTTWWARRSTRSGGSLRSSRPQWCASPALLPRQPPHRLSHLC